MGCCTSAPAAAQQPGKQPEQSAPAVAKAPARPLSLGKRKSASNGHQGNLVVDGFLKYVTGATGWKPVKHVRNKQLLLEAYPDDEPLGSWRGSYAVETATYEDVLSYLKDKLGPDQFELLEDDDTTMVFREYFNFAQFAKKGAFVPKVAGDHRGEAAERMSDLHRPSMSKARSSALHRQKSNLGSTPEVPEEDAALDDDDDDDEDDADDGKKSLRKVRARCPLKKKRRH